MKCDDVNRLILLALIFTVIGDALALVAELLAQRCERKEEAEGIESEKEFIVRLKELERRISKLEKV